ncbi:MAG: hypothetical protein ABSD39_18850 [Terriglobales bacterium]
MEKLNPSLAVPAMATRDSVVYVAYRSFDWLRQSDQLQVLAYDLNSHNVLKHRTISVPKVHGSRATNGLALSHDGAMLAYVEVHEPSLVLLISAKDLSEVRRSSSLPFTTQDYRRQFAGFDGEDHLSFSSINRDKPRFVHVATTDFKTVSDTRASAITKTVFDYVTWNPVAGRFWLPDGGGNVIQFNEEGRPTGEELKTDVHQLDQGAIALGQSGVMAFYAMVSRGAIASYTNHKSRVLELPCSPRPYGASNDHAYAGAICITQPDRLPEAGGLRVLTSDFLLIRADGPQVVWRQTMSALGAGDNDHFEWASAVIEEGNKNIRVVVPTKSPELSVYEVTLGESSASPMTTTH